jgi:hypothetical protein
VSRRETGCCRNVVRRLISRAERRKTRCRAERRYRRAGVGRGSWGKGRQRSGRRSRRKLESTGLEKLSSRERRMTAERDLLRLRATSETDG